MEKLGRLVRLVRAEIASHSLLLRSKFVRQYFLVARARLRATGVH